MGAVHQPVIEQRFGSIHETSEKTFRYWKSVHNNQVCLSYKINEHGPILVYIWSISLETWQPPNTAVKVSHADHHEPLLPQLGQLCGHQKE